MRVLTAFIAVLWWIALWGISDVLTGHWSRGARAAYYGTLLIIVTAWLLYYPDTIERF
jgi:hypothetical protein